MNDENTPVENEAAESPVVTQEIAVLEKLSKELGKPESENVTIQNCRIGEIPMNAVEESLGNFVCDAFRVAKGDFDFNSSLQKHIMERVDKGDYTPNQEIALYSNHNVNMNDKLAKLINPFAQISVAKTQADIQAQKEKPADGAEGAIPVGGDYRAVNQIATKEVIQGMQALNSILEMFKLQKEKDGTE
jgi:hypothetical protein